MQIPCTFEAVNILDIDGTYHHTILFTIGAITWIEDLAELFNIVSHCLVENGVLILHDFHPVMNMLLLVGEKEYQEGRAELLKHKYFTNQLWIENEGMKYISSKYPSKTCISYSHSLSNIINTILQANMRMILG